MNKFKSVYKLINIDEYSATPKYLQLANSILNGINEEKIKKDDLMPSINELSFNFDISRDTAEKGYAYLKNIGVMASVPGKGFFIRDTDFKRKIKIFLLFNKLSFHKKIIYDAFVETLGDNAAIDFYIYNNDFSLFKKLLASKKEEDYTHYVLIPHFLDQPDNVSEVINTIPKQKLILLDKLVPDVDGEFGAVYENFSKDVYSALTEAAPQLTKYSALRVIFPDHSYYPVEILHGVKRFCKEYRMECDVINKFSEAAIHKGDVFVTLMEDDLVQLIETILASELKIGQDIGIISYNETPLKKIILNGITTISTDFKAMGTSTAQMILNNVRRHEAVPFRLTLRKSL